MSMRRRKGRDTFERLLNWDQGQTDGERLAALLLHAEGFESVDPSHPLGGSDGLKDVLCRRDGMKWVGAAYFPRGQKAFTNLKEKFRADLAGVSQNRAQGFVFVTNQEVRIAQRRQLEKLATGHTVDLLHLERIASILNKPECYGIRLEFLDIEMTKEEQLSFIANRDSALKALQVSFDSIATAIQRLIARGETSPAPSNVTVSLSELKEFKTILDSVIGSNPFGFTGSLSGGLLVGARNINGLRVPLPELRQFAELLDRITGHPAFTSVTAASTLTVGGAAAGHVSKLRVPIDDLREYEKILDRIIEKLREKAFLEISRAPLLGPPSKP